MKKLYFLIFFLCSTFLIFTIFYFLPHDYNINYKIDGYSINQEFNKKTKIYNFKIKKDDEEFLYSVSDKYYNKRKQIKYIQLNNIVLNVKLNNLEDFYIIKNNNEYYTTFYDEQKNDETCKN